jgi:hypothetical protein
MLVSECCGSMPLYQLSYKPDFIKQSTGICSCCGEHADFDDNFDMSKPTLYKKEKVPDVHRRGYMIKKDEKKSI